MKKTYHTTEQIIRILREADDLLGRVMCLLHDGFPFVTRKPSHPQWPSSEGPNHPPRVGGGSAFFVRRQVMSRYLPLPVLVTYCVYAIFATQQKFCIVEYRNRERRLGYYLLLGYFAFFTWLFGLGYLVFYGFRTTWWPPLVIWTVGYLIYFPLLRFRLVTERLPVAIWGLLSFAAIPICATLLIHFTPRF